MEVTQEQTTEVDTSNLSAQPDIAPEKPSLEAEKPEITTKDAILQNAEKATKTREKTAKTSDVPAPAPAFQANLKYKVMDKEHEIPKDFAGLIKDAESEKKIREIFERSTGLDHVKENLATTRTERDDARKQYAELNGSVNDLKSTYQEAIASGDMHKLDKFWNTLKIPQDVIMQYALAKVQLNEMPPEQRQAVEQKQRAEMEASDYKRQQAQMSESFMRNQAQMKTLMLESAFNRPENQSAASDFDTRVGKPGMFQQEVRRWGEQEWLRSGGKLDLSPDQAIAAVIKHYGLSTEAKVVSAAPAAPATPKDPRQNVIVKPVGTIPNLGAGGSTSPLKSKPKSIDDLKNLATRAAAGEAI